MRNSMLMTTVVVTMLLLITPAGAALRSDPVPGGVVIVDLGPARMGQRPRAHFLQRQVMVTRRAENWVAVVGIPLSTEPGMQELKVSQPDGKRHRLGFEVVEKLYPEQRITLKDKGKVDLSPESLKRVAREKKLIDGYKASWTDKEQVDLQFSAPVIGPLSGRFGLKRYFNDKPRKPHSGLDFAAAEGSPVKAPASGTVVGVGDFFFNGKAVFIDHGQGLISLYGHLSRIDVRQGQAVAGGDLLGAVGKTGRATGAHLHWTLLLNGTAVDPELFIAVP